MQLLDRLADVYAATSIDRPALKQISFAQWMLESGRGTSELATRHYNFAGLKWRAELAPFARRIDYRAHDGTDAYAKFATIADFIAGYWAFIGRAPYVGWQAHADSPQRFIDFVGPIYTPAPGYAARVAALLPQATAALAKANGTRATQGGTNLGTVVLDPGHGGKAATGGSSPNNAISASGTPEKNLTLDFCMILRDLLIDQATAADEAIRVVPTRSADVNIGIAQRAAIAARTKADALVCLHFNGSADRNVRGTETYYAALQNGNIDMAQDVAFAGAVQAGFVRGMRAVDGQAKDRGTKPDTQSGPGSLGLLRDTAIGNAASGHRCVAAYVEAEFITNAAVDAALVSSMDALANRARVLAPVAEAVRGWLRGR